MSFVFVNEQGCNVVNVSSLPSLESQFIFTLRMRGEREEVSSWDLLPGSFSERDCQLLRRCFGEPAGEMSS